MVHSSYSFKTDAIALCVQNYEDIFLVTTTSVHTAIICYYKYQWGFWVSIVIVVSFSVLLQK